MGLFNLVRYVASRVLAAKAQVMTTLERGIAKLLNVGIDRYAEAGYIEAMFAEELAEELAGEAAATGGPYVADGGVDAIISAATEKTTLQVKHWETAVTSDVVRDTPADYLGSTNGFTDAARAVAEQRGIGLREWNDLSLARRAKLPIHRLSQLGSKALAKGYTALVNAGLAAWTVFLGLPLWAQIVVVLVAAYVGYRVAKWLAPKLAAWWKRFSASLSDMVGSGASQSTPA